MTNRNAIRYALDANVLIAAYHDYYAPGICPGFWDCLAYQISAGRLLIIDRVYDEILSPSWLVDWSEQAANDAPIDTASQPVADAYRGLMDWVQENSQFLPAARAEFARVADGWLVAYALANDAVAVVSNEAPAPDARRKVPLPDLCDQFGVRLITPFAMLHELGARFHWTPPG